MQPWLDELMKHGEFIATIAMVWVVISRINRDESLRKDYPPHRHSNGTITYPPDYSPGTVEHLQRNNS